MTALDVLMKAGEVVSAGGIAWLGNWLVAREKTKHAEVEVAVAKTLADADTKRAEEDTKRFGIKAKSESDSKCLELVKAQNEQIASMSEKFTNEIGELREENAVTRESLKHCQEQHGESKAEILRMQGQIDRLQNNSNPPPAIAAE